MVHVLYALDPPQPRPFEQRPRPLGKPFTLPSPPHPARHRCLIVAFVRAPSPSPPSKMVSELEKAVRADLQALIKEKKCHGIMVRLAWHDAGTCWV